MANFVASPSAFLAEEMVIVELENSVNKVAAWWEIAEKLLIAPKKDNFVKIDNVALVKRTESAELAGSVNNLCAKQVVEARAIARTIRSVNPEPKRVWDATAQKTVKLVKCAKTNAVAHV